VKTCLRCQQELPISSFGLTTAGNPRSWCKACHAAYKAAWKKTERGRESEKADRKKNGSKRRERFKERHPERHREMQRRSARNYAKKHAAKLSEKARRLRKERPEVYWAGQIVRAMIFFGMMVRRPCESCGASRAQAHHPDHTKPLAVIWLCGPCHARLGDKLRDPATAIVERVAPKAAA